jgi:hypothetical protein
MERRGEICGDGGQESVAWHVPDVARATERDVSFEVGEQRKEFFPDERRRILERVLKTLFIRKSAPAITLCYATSPPPCSFMPIILSSKAYRLRRLKGLD